MAQSYLICTIQRTGSWLLCHALQDTGVAGIPAEYFHAGDAAFWAQRWDVAPEDDGAYFAAMRRESTPNGVFGSKMMWNYFEPAMARLRKVLGVDEELSDPDLLARFLPDLSYVWLRRRDTVRHAISHWRAVTTGEYGLAADQMPGPPPPYDREEIARFVRLHRTWDTAWKRWFADHAIEPLVLTYEDIIDDLAGAVRAVLAHVGIDQAGPVLSVTPRMQRQADATTEQYAARYLAGQ